MPTGRGRWPGRAHRVATGQHVLLAGLLAGVAPAASHAQPARTLTACTPEALAVCAELRLIASPSSFELGLRAIGAADTTLALGIYNLVLGTGAPAAGDPRTTSLVPAAIGGATVTDASAWEVFDAGDVLFLSALTNRGVGGCAAGADVDGFGQAANTCGAGAFVTFTFAPTALFDPGAFTVLNLEAVALTTPLRAASCGAPGAACVIRADTAAVVPEPSLLALSAAGIVGLLAVGATRRSRRPTG